MIVYRYLLMLLSAFVFLGCSTMYQPNSFTGGYSETRLSENVFNVVFKGNRYTGWERASDFTLLRSAELTLNNDYKYFVIASSEKHADYSAYTTAKTYNTTFQASTYGNQTYGSANTISNGGDTHISSRPSTNNTIVCFKEKPNTNDVIYDAQFIIKSIKTKYKIEE